MQPSFLIENNFDTNLICGIDEAGRGPLAGPVVASCFLMNKNLPLEKINDSKKLTKKNRAEIYQILSSQGKYGIGVVNEEIIDKVNILEATKIAMKLAYQDFCKKYKIFPKILLIDGNFIPFKICDDLIKILPAVKGDEKSYTIASASIIAKQYRDDLMTNYHKNFPQYGFNKNFGYGTKLHLENIKKLGICKIHRQSFEPIKSMINVSN